MLHTWIMLPRLRASRCLLTGFSNPAWSPVLWLLEVVALVAYRPLLPPWGRISKELRTCWWSEVLDVRLSFIAVLVWLLRPCHPGVCSTNLLAFIFFCIVLVMVESSYEWSYTWQNLYIDTLQTFKSTWSLFVYWYNLKVRIKTSIIQS